MNLAITTGRLTGLAVGLGIGAALAAFPGDVRADSSTDWLSTMDNLLGVLSVPASSASTLDYQVSIDGYDLFPTAGNEATATSGTGDIAVAIGDGASATANDGYGDVAVADGTDSTALSQGGNFDYSSASGEGSGAGTGTGSGDIAIASGTDTAALAGGDTVTDSGGTTTYLGNDDVAYALGPNSIAESGGLLSETASSNDIAAVLDPLGTMGSEAFAGVGNSDLAAVFGDGLTASVTEVSNMVDIAP
jgi:hypothetical protein